MTQISPELAYGIAMVGTVAGFCLAFLLKMAYGRIEKLEDRIAALAENLPKDYVTKSDFTEFKKETFIKLDSIYNLLTSKT